jgi:transcriptional regulator with PAS, ATPase and Fis domain
MLTASEHLPVSPLAGIRQALARWTPSLLPSAERIALAAEHDVTVLLTGETGTGKTYLARLIHEYSPRRDQRFVAVSCGALAPSLIESEFFGHAKGAFTGAERPRRGRFALAGQGTLLLDEVDALPIDQQANLLRVVETGEYEPLGSDHTERAECRVIAASNRDLQQEVGTGRFREDLYYRLNVVRVTLLPLRERAKDVPTLVQGLTQRYAIKFGKVIDEVTHGFLNALIAYHWPGNIRELENVIQSAVLHCRGTLLDVAEVPVHLLEAIDSPRPVTLVDHKTEMERETIVSALEAHAHQRSGAARQLGISRVTLYKKMKKYGLMSPKVLPLRQPA